MLRLQVSVALAALIASGSQDLDRLWGDLASEDAAAAFRAMGELANSKAAPTYLKEHLKPIPAPDAKRIEKLVEDLNSPQYPVRQKANGELEKLADLAAPTLRQQLEKKPSLEVSKRIEVLLEKLDGPVTSPELLRGLRAVEVLEWVGTPEAQTVLEPIAAGAPGHRLTEAAQDTLKRLKKRGKDGA
jgi:hypothetical protein